MIPFIIIRPFRNEDLFACQNVIKDYILSFVNRSFWFCVFKEVFSVLIFNSLEIVDNTIINENFLNKIFIDRLQFNS